MNNKGIRKLSIMSVIIFVAIVLTACLAMKFAVKTVARMITGSVDYASSIVKVTPDEVNIADLIVVDLQKPHLQPIHDLVSNLVYCGKASDVDTVVVDGRIVVENRRVAGVNLPALYAAVAAAVKRITAK